MTGKPSSLVTFALALGMLAMLAPESARAAEVCDSQICVDGADWSSGEQLDDKTRAREAKRNRKAKDKTLTVELASGRASVFLDGVWIAPAPINYVPIKPGKHDVEIRDGERVLARGVLEIGKKAGDVTLKIL
jgi:hypothetical protein